MNDDMQKPPTAPPPQQESDSALSRASATLGIISILLFFIPLIVRVFLWGFARGLDLGHISPIMAIGVWLGLIGFILGMIAVFRKGRKRLAKIGIAIFGLEVLVILLIPLCV